MDTGIVSNKKPLKEILCAYAIVWRGKIGYDDALVAVRDCDAENGRQLRSRLATISTLRQERISSQYRIRITAQAER